jgi:DnaK suppressor protein
MARTEQIRKVQQQLLRRRETLTRSLNGEIGSLKNLHESGVGDELDASLAAEQMELGGQLAEVESRELAKINAALERISAGRYGKCDTCGGTIKAARLQAVPHAAECIDCARAGERREQDGDNPRGTSSSRWAMSPEEAA